MIPLVAPSYSPADKILAQWDTDVQVRLFEEEFAAYVGCVGGVAVNSGTSALMIALNAYTMKDGPFTEAMIPSYTCRSLLDACQWIADEVRFCDNVCDVPRAQFGATKISTVVSHMFGTRAPKPGVIDDITLSLGADIPFDVAVCSFNRDKMISTGRGGMIVSNDEAFLEDCRELAYYDQPRRELVTIDGQEIAVPMSRYSPAFSFGMTGMQAALGRSQLKQLPGFIERRKEIAARYTTAFQRVGIETPALDVDSVFFRYIIGVVDPAERVKELAAVGVEAGRGVNPPLHRLLGLPNDQFPGAESCFRTLLSVPVHPSLTDEQVGFITEQVLQVCAP